MDIIGQQLCIKNFNKVIDKESFFTIFTGQPHQGKKYITTQVLKNANVNYKVLNGEDLSVDALRELIETQVNTVFVVYSIDRISKRGQNILLKTLEEGNIKLIGICTSISTLIYPLISRAFLIEMNPYTPEELILFNEGNNNIFEDWLIRLSTSPAELLLFKGIGIQKLVDTINILLPGFKTISFASLLNALKILNQEGVDGELFILMLLRIYELEYYNYYVNVHFDILVLIYEARKLIREMKSMELTILETLLLKIKEVILDA